MKVDKKKRIFINSTGRTGTQFFAKNLGQMIEGAVALHESGTPWLSKPKKLLKQVGDYGIFHLTLGQGLSSHSFYKLSRDVVAGQVGRYEALSYTENIVGKTDALYKEDIIIESSGHIYGVLDVLDELYDDSRFIYIVRDPRTWIESALKKTEYSLYGPVELLYKNISLQPKCFKDDPYKDQWPFMSKFEKYCWFYNKMNEVAIQSMIGKENFKIYRYEDIFLSPYKSFHFKDLLNFATDFNDGQIKSNFFPALLNKRVDSKTSSAESLEWEKWDKPKAKILYKHCKHWMTEFEYGQELLWKEKIGS